MNNLEDTRRIPRALRSHLQHTELKNLNFHEKHGNLLLILPMFSRKSQMKFFLKFMRNRSNSGVVPCAENLKFGMRLSLALLSITKKSEISKTRARLWRHIKNHENVVFWPKIAKKCNFWFHVLQDGSVASYRGSGRLQSCSPGLSSNYTHSNKQKNWPRTLTYLATKP